MGKNDSPAHGAQRIKKLVILREQNQLGPREPSSTSSLAGLSISMGQQHCGFLHSLLSEVFAEITLLIHPGNRGQ